MIPPDPLPSWLTSIPASSSACMICSWRPGTSPALIWAPWGRVRVDAVLLQGAEDLVAKPRAAEVDHLALALGDLEVPALERLADGLAEFGCPPVTASIGLPSPFSWLSDSAYRRGSRSRGRAGA